MRGENESTQAMFSYVSPEGMVPKDHPLRLIKAMADAALKQISIQFDGIYSHTGRPSIPPEKLLKASLLQAFYTIRSERQLVEQIGYNILFRWFLDMALDEKPWDATVCQWSLKIPPFRSPKIPPLGYSLAACLDRRPALSFSLSR
jgi:hypothetical protein